MPAKLEAVFLPYKTSMWDLLESIRKAADENPNCDAYCGDKSSIVQLYQQTGKPLMAQTKVFCGGNAALAVVSIPDNNI